jgi:hypothetical protein
MATFLAADTLRDAVERLGDCVAQGAVADYLVFKRALVNTKSGSRTATTVTTGLESKPFQDAITELAACSVPGTTWNGQPFFSPFGWSRDRQRGFKGPKYPSNGPSDTIAGWQSRSSTPLRVVPDSRPKQYTFETRAPCVRVVAA